MLHVIGIGSPFGDDRIGLLLIDELRRSEKLRPYVGHALGLHQLDRPGAGLLAHIEGMSDVMLIDAVLTEGVAGCLYCWRDPASFDLDQCVHSSHAIGLATTLSLGRVLGLLPPRLTIIGVAIGLSDADHPSQTLERPLLLSLVTQLEERVLEDLRGESGELP